MILDKIVEATKIRVEKSMEAVSFETLYSRALCSGYLNHRFEKALRKDGLSFICEVKKGSPSKGIISEDFPYMDIAKNYEQCGADCISVLTEPDFFKGDNRYLSEISKTVTTPLLRKDFIIDEYQIYEAKNLGASAILLICAILTQEQLNEYYMSAINHGMSVLVETHNEREVEMALECGAEIIGVNNRDLNDFSVDLRTSERLRKYVPEDKVFVSESGISTPEDIKRVREYGADAVLIGEAFMRAENIGEMMERLRR